MHKFFRGIAGLALLVLTACQTPVADTGTGPIKIGFIGPLTGEAASYGTDTLNGTKLAVEEINAAAGINGRMIELIAEDGRCTGGDSAAAAQKLVNVDKVVAIIGGQCSGETLAAAPIAEAAQVIMISPISSSPDVTNAGDFVFRDYPSDALKTKAMKKFFEEEGYSKIAMISENTDFATAFRQSLIADIGEDSIVFDEIVEPGTKDFRTLITRLAELEFDAFFPNAQTDAVMAAMLQQLREQGVAQQFITHDVGDQLTLFDLAPEAVEGMLVINVPTAGEGGSFQATVDSQFGGASASIAFVAHAYDATNVLFEAIANVGTDGTAIRDYLYNLVGFEGIIGTFGFDNNGDVTGVPYSLKELKDGVIVEVRPISVN